MPARILHRISLAVFVVAAVALAAGCSRRETDVERGNREGILFLASGGEPRDIDPTTNIGSAESRMISALFEGLVVYSPDGKKVMPAAAERWDISLDGLTYTFHLRDGMKWSNGDPVTADDFLYGFRRVLEPAIGAEAAQQAMPILGAADYAEGRNKDINSVGLRAIDPRTFEIRLAHPAPYFLGQLTNYPFMPLHRPTLEKFNGYLRRDSGWTRPGNLVGNGAFRLKSWRTNEAVIVEKNPQYWNAGNVRLNEVHFRVIDTPDAEELAFRGGRIHLTYGLTATKADSYRASKSPYFRSEQELATYWITFNVALPPFNDARVRKAFALAADRNALAHDVLRGQQPAEHLVADGAGGFTPTARLKRDPERARALLAEAGFPGGQGFPTVNLTYTAARAGWKEACEALQFMWQKELGVRVELAQIEYKVWLEALRTKKHQVAFESWLSGVDDPVEWMGLYVSGSPNNDAQWSNAAYDAHFAAADRAVTQADRFAHFQAMGELLLEEMPILPLYHLNHHFLKQTSVRGWEEKQLASHPLEYVWLDPNAPARPLGVTTLP
jgi:oligopeptide transport system substrate-binding protein